MKLMSYGGINWEPMVMSTVVLVALGAELNSHLRCYVDAWVIISIVGLVLCRGIRRGDSVPWHESLP